MALAACPRCAMPRSDADIAGQPCPLCGYAAGDAVAAYVDEPPLAEVSPVAEVAPAAAKRHHRPALRVAAVAAATLLAGVALGTQLAGTRTVEVKSTLAVEVPAQAPALTLPTRKAEPPPVAVAREVAPPPREVGAAPPSPPPAVALPGGVSLLRLDRPNDIYTLERLAEGNHVKLVGRVLKLTVHGVDGGATLDAGELETKTVSVTGPVEGNAHVRLHATDGTVTFSKPISGGARVEVDAPNGMVTFSAHAPAAVGAPISGGSNVRVSARSVWFSRRIDGGSTVEVTVANGGSLKFLELAGGSKLHYRFEKPDDAVKVLPGQIDDSSECKRLD